MKLGERIKLRRIELGLTQEDLAKRLGYKSNTTVNKVELGINDITQSKIVRYAEALNTTPSWLMGWEDEEIEEIISGETALQEARLNVMRERWMDEVGTLDFTDEELGKLIDYANYILSMRK